MPLLQNNCGSAAHLSRRTLLGAAGAGLSWLTPLAQALGRQEERHYMSEPPRSVIILWMQGGPSQLETFDPHPTTKIGGGTKGIDTALKGIQLAKGYERTAAQLQDLTLIRSMVSREGDHERATYNMKTGYRPDPTLVHPALGSVVCHQLSDKLVEIPRHVSISPSQWPARGGYMGDEFDAFKIFDPGRSIPDVRQRVNQDRQVNRLKTMRVAESAFARGRRPDLDQKVTLHQHTVDRALKMMTSDQLKAFDLSDVPIAETEGYGDSAFGRGCLAAIRLLQVGVRCVEVTLSGWDTHANNASNTAKQAEILDPAFAALIHGLKSRGMLERTIVLCGGEFGRTPKINVAEGRDHWPHAFSMAVAGGGFRSGYVHGQTDPTGEEKKPVSPVRVKDLHATIMHQLGIDPAHELMTPVGRPMALSEGRIIRELLT